MSSRFGAFNKKPRTKGVIFLGAGGHPMEIEEGTKIPTHFVVEMTHFLEFWAWITITLYGSLWIVGQIIQSPMVGPIQWVKSSREICLAKPSTRWSKRFSYWKLFHLNFPCESCLQRWGSPNWFWERQQTDRSLFPFKKSGRFFSRRGRRGSVRTIYPGLIYKYICEPGSKLLILGVVIPPLIGHPYTGYIYIKP